MKNDIILKLIVSFLFPIILVYSFTSILYSNLYESISIISGIILFILVSILFQFRFRKINIINVYRYVKLEKTFLFILFGFFITLLILLME